MPDIIEKARTLRRKIEELACSGIPDNEEAAEYMDLFPNWNPNSVAYVTGDRVKFSGELYRVLQAHTSAPEWTPTNAPSLFARVLNPDPEVIPVWVQPDSTNAYMTGDKVHYPGINDPVYESLIDHNVWSPDGYPDGWRIVE